MVSFIRAVVPPVDVIDAMPGRQDVSLDASGVKNAPLDRPPVAQFPEILRGDIAAAAQSMQIKGILGSTWHSGHFSRRRGSATIDCHDDRTAPSVNSGFSTHTEMIALAILAPDIRRWRSHISLTMSATARGFEAKHDDDFAML